MGKKRHGFRGASSIAADNGGPVAKASLDAAQALMDSIVSKLVKAGATA
jgi:hypothetical protein